MQEKLKTRFNVIKSGCGFAHRKYDVSGGRCLHDKFSTIYDYILADQDVVANTLLDLKNVENVLVIPSDEEAQVVLSSSAKVPKKCKYALTFSGYTYYPAPNYRTYAPAAEGRMKSRILQVGNKSRKSRNR